MGIIEVSPSARYTICFAAVLQFVCAFGVLTPKAYSQKSASAEGGYMVSGSPISALIDELVTASAREDYDHIYDLLDHEYTRSLARDLFIREMKESNYQISEASIQLDKAYPGLAYGVVEAVARDGDHEVRSLEVVFANRNADGSWSLVNLPWPPTGLPDIARVPDCFMHGL